MNKERRKELTRIHREVEIGRERLSEAHAILDEARGALEIIRDEEQEAFNNMPEGLQQGEKGQASEQAIENLESAYDSLDSIVNSIESDMDDFDEILQQIDDASA